MVRICRGRRPRLLDHAGHWHVRLGRHHSLDGDADPHQRLLHRVGGVLLRRQRAGRSQRDADSGQHLALSQHRHGDRWHHQPTCAGVSCGDAPHPDRSQLSGPADHGRWDHPGGVQRHASSWCRTPPRSVHVCLDRTDDGDGIGRSYQRHPGFTYETASLVDTFPEEEWIRSGRRLRNNQC